MAKFRYQALDDSGKTRTGVIAAEEKGEANKAIFEMGLTTLRIERERGQSIDWKTLGRRFQRVKSEDLVLFTKQLVTTIRVGIPIVQCLATLEFQGSNPVLRRIARQLHDDVQQGSSLTRALERHPAVFNQMYCSIVAAGERSGTLPEVMDRLIYLVEHEAAVKREVRGAMRYPVMVVVALGLAFLVMVGFVIPKFSGFFSKAGLELPWPTKACLWLSDVFQNYGWLVLILAVGGFLAYSIGVKSRTGQLARDRFFLKIPLVNQVLIKAAMTRFASIFAILQSSGVMILESFQILSQTIGNAAIASQFEDLSERLQEGRGIAGPLAEAKYFPPLLVSMVAIGEETGRLDEMLRQISDHYDEELRFQMKKMSDAIGPLLVVGLAAVVGFFALAIYMPMWDLTQMAQ